MKHIDSTVSNRIPMHNKSLNFHPSEVKSAVGQILQSGDSKVLAVEQNKVLIPPLYQRYLAWGFSDMSMRIGNYDSEKVKRC